MSRRQWQLWLSNLTMFVAILFMVTGLAITDPRDILAFWVSLVCGAFGMGFWMISEKLWEENQEADDADQT